MHRRELVLFTCVAFLFVSPASGQACSPFWVETDPFDLWQHGENGPVGAIVAQDAHGFALFTSAYLFGSGGESTGLARWDGHRWSYLTQGLPPQVQMPVPPPVALDDDTGRHAYVIGYDGQNYSLWWWNGTQWQPAPQGMLVVEGATIAEPDCSANDGTGTSIYGNIFDDAGIHIARWRSDHWDVVADLENMSNFWLWGLDAGDGPALYVAGEFDGVAGVPGTHGIAKYQNGQWHALGTGIRNQRILAMTVYDDGRGPALYVGGFLIDASGVPVQNLVRWRNGQWEPVPGVPDGPVRGMAVFDDGSGPSLFCSGDFQHAGGVTAHHFARFDGSNWHAIDDVGTPSVSQSIVVFDDGRGPSLFVTTGGGSVGGGHATTAGQRQYVGCHNCYADITNGHRLNVLDFMEFLRRYAAHDPYADCNRDLVENSADFICYVSKFAAGCP